MFTKIMQWVPILALLLVVSWRPSSNYQIALDFVVCAGAVTMVLALFFIKTRNRGSVIASITDPTPPGEPL
jgi:hypothetical protein